MLYICFMEAKVKLTKEELQALVSKAKTLSAFKNIFVKVYGMPFKDIVSTLKKTAENNYDCYHNKFVIASNLNLMYTTNPNFANGIKNGYGKGVYLCIPAYGLGSKQVKIK